jgi:hypothetical protein
MTIAMCYVSPEGVVLGADSTTTFVDPGLHFYNHNQKLYEVGENSTLGMLTWGRGSLIDASYRTLIAQLAKSCNGLPPDNGLDVANRWISIFYPLYNADKAVLEYGRFKVTLQSRNRILDAPYSGGGKFICEAARRTHGWILSSGQNWPFIDAFCV